MKKFNKTYKEGNIVEYNEKMYFFDRYTDNTKKRAIIKLIDDDDLDLKEGNPTFKEKEVYSEYLKPYQNW